MARVYFDKTKWILRCSKHKQTKSIQLSAKKFLVLILFCTVASLLKSSKLFEVPESFFIVANVFSATSDGSREGLNQRQGGSCVTHNMRVQVRVHTKFQDRYEGERESFYYYVCLYNIFIILLLFLLFFYCFFFIAYSVRWARKSLLVIFNRVFGEYGFWFMHKGIL